MTKKIKITFITLLGLLPVILLVRIVYAQELTISGNGDGSTSEVNVKADTNTNVQQSNDAQIQNNANTASDTGNNQASSNTGSAAIQTGSSDNSTTINNQDINTNVVDGKTGGTSVDAQVTGNGSGSTNTLNVNSSNTTNVTQNNNANIDNTSSTTSNTGNNSANSNNGDVGISTGNITSNVDIENKNINKSVDNLENCDCEGESISVKISGNGSGSNNDVNVNSQKSITLSSNNFANILNIDIQDLNTGNNSASFNNGNVFITTGDIASFVRIANENINQNFASIICPVCQVIPPITPPVTPPSGGGEVNPPSVPPTPTSVPPSEQAAVSSQQVASVASQASSESNPGQVLGAFAEQLPITGAYWFLIATLLSIMIFLLGWYLRLRSGTSPPAYVK